MDLKEVIKKRRALRSLKKVVFNEKEIEQIFRLATLSPSCFNKQPWRFIFVKSEEKMNLVKDALSSGNKWALNASAFILVLANKKDGCVLKDGREYFLYDTGIISGYIMLLFTEYGYVAHPIAGFSQSKIKKYFMLDEETTVISIIVLGGIADNIDETLSDEEKYIELNRPKRHKIDDILKIL